MESSNIAAFIIGVISTATIYLFGQPAGVMSMALIGVALASYRNAALDTKRKLIGWTVFGAIVTSILLELVQFVATYYEIKNIPLKPIALILGFVLFDAQLRNWAVKLIKSKIERLLQ